VFKAKGIEMLLRVAKGAQETKRLHEIRKKEIYEA
jgi:hypothetical protein